MKLRMIGPSFLLSGRGRRRRGLEGGREGGREGGGCVVVY